MPQGSLSTPAGASPRGAGARGAPAEPRAELQDAGARLALRGTPREDHLDGAVARVDTHPHAPRPVGAAHDVGGSGLGHGEAGYAAHTTTSPHAALTSREGP